MWGLFVNWLARKRIADLENRLRLAHQDIKNEVELRHHAEMKVAASRYGETFSSRPVGRAIPGAQIVGGRRIL